MKRILVALGCALTFGGCGDRPLTWYYRLADDIDGVALTEARIRAGGCEGEVVHEQRFAPGEAMTPPSLGAGEYGFEVEVRDAECNVIGAGCQAITLPEDGGAIVVEVRGEQGGAACDEGVCEAGRCVGEEMDAGAEGGMDGGARPDAGECAGCFDGDTCVTGDSVSACGKGGGACERCTCESDGDVCSDGACVPSEPITSVAAGRTHTCAVRGGVLYCWGTGQFGQLADSWSSPRETPDPSDAAPGWLEVSTSRMSTCGRRGDALLCWGSNVYGQLGLGAGADENVATAREVVGGRSWTQVSVGHWHTLAIDDAGQLFCFGHTDNESCATSGDNLVEPTQIGSETWDDACAGLWQSCGIRGGELYCWGWSFDGETGTGVVGSTVAEPTRVGDGADWREVSCGTGHTCARREDGRVSCFGCGDDSCYTGVESACGGDCSGALGTGIAASAASPVEIPGLRARTIDAGVHTCAVAMDGTLHCWGPNVHGQLGTGDSEPRDVPTRVPGEGWQDVSVSEQHTCAIRETGALYCWGQNEMFQLGTDTSPDDHLTPTRVCFD